MHNVGEWNDIEELLEECNVVVDFVDDKDVGIVEEPLSCTLKVRVLVVVEVVKAKDVIAATLQGVGDVG
ncbi:PAS domain S-box protein, partial [Sesbania bispinosa]